LKKASCQFCIKKTIENYKNALVSNNENKISSLRKNKRNLSSKLSEQTTEVKTYSEEEYNTLKEANAKLQSEIDALKQTNASIVEENKTVSASLDSLKGEYRKDKVASILSNVFYKTDDDRSKAIESFSKSGMTYEEIDTHVSPLRSLKGANVNHETKLPQKSAAVEDKEPYFLKLQKFYFGGSA
jgi:uncharacterized phage infection (PIP) family protein YhgE